MRSSTSVYDCNLLEHLDHHDVPIRLEEILRTTCVLFASIATHTAGQILNGRANIDLRVVTRDQHVHRAQSTR